MAANIIHRTFDSYGFEQWGRPGQGRRLTVWVMPGHVVMEIDGGVFGTSYSNPGGGPGWFEPSQGYLSSAIARRPPARVGSRHRR